MLNLQRKIVEAMLSNMQKQIARRFGNEHFIFLLQEAENNVGKTQMRFFTT
jgi:hypothetical protein